MSADKAKLLATLLAFIIKRQVKPEGMVWLEEKAKLVAEDKNATTLGASFAAVPRKTGRFIAEITADELTQIDQLYSTFTVKDWPIDKLTRLWLLLQVDPADETRYHSRIESLFRDAEMNELAALYSALPVLAYPESWRLRTAEGIRSNIGLVLESIMYENPYPFKCLQEQAWNQMVMKAFFTEKDVNRIIGLDERANKALASILIDYAHERQAAHRAVNPQLWRLISKFIDEDIIQDIEKLFDDTHITVRRAAALACVQSDYQPAKLLLEREPAIYASIKANKLTWNSL
ncbi:MAG: EboA domain-containing protein [Chitinophagaceae bacterium]